jgi:hypothetical protein
MKPFNFRVYNRRRNNYATYELTFIKSGWQIQGIVHNGDSQPDGTPFLYKNFAQDQINYPSNVGGFLHHIWLELDHETLSESEAQSMLSQLANWVSDCEKNQPNWVGYNSHA